MKKENEASFIRITPEIFEQLIYQIEKDGGKTETISYEEYHRRRDAEAKDRRNKEIHKKNLVE
jgi:hypothetical protein